MTDRSPSFAMAHGWHRGHHSSFIERHCGLAKLPDFMVPGFSKALGGCHISGNPGELAECTSISQHLVFENLRHLHFGAKIPWLDGQNYIVSNSFCGNTFSRGAGNSHDFFFKNWFPIHPWSSGQEIPKAPQSLSTGPGCVWICWILRSDKPSGNKMPGCFSKVSLKWKLSMNTNNQKSFFILCRDSINHAFWTGACTPLSSLHKENDRPSFAHPT